jgi:hypothetical protein
MEMKMKKGSEDELQCEVATLLDDITRLGGLKCWFHIANERNCNIAQGVLLKRKGVKKGVPDNCLIFNDGSVMFIELKVGKGVQSQAQKAWEDALKQANIPIHVCYNLKEVIQCVKNKLEKKDQLFNYQLTLLGSIP